MEQIEPFLWIFHERTTGSGEHIRVVAQGHAMFRMPCNNQGPLFFLNRFQITVEVSGSLQTVMVASLTDVAVLGKKCPTDLLAKVTALVAAAN